MISNVSAFPDTFSGLVTLERLVLCAGVQAGHTYPALPSLPVPTASTWSAPASTLRVPGRFLPQRRPKGPSSLSNSTVSTTPGNGRREGNGEYLRNQAWTQRSHLREQFGRGAGSSGPFKSLPRFPRGVKGEVHVALYTPKPRARFWQPEPRPNPTAAASVSRPGLAAGSPSPASAQREVVARAGRRRHPSAGPGPPQRPP